jgi:hypothetical protein
MVNEGMVGIQAVAHIGKSEVFETCKQASEISRDLQF